MTDKENNVQFYSNQPYDMEMKLDNSEDSGSKDDSEGKMEKVPNQKFDQDEDDEVKPLPKFDISQFQRLQTTPELQELFSIMQR